uniref:AA_permease domain-containing protein n=1 Tax=Heterorhabditis bacteriophora TaxID=37862 RepID=A0A1I7WX10_HETBA
MVGILGCWRRSPKIILVTSLILLFAVLFLAAGMASWHYVNYLERYVLDVAPFYKAWEPILKTTTRFNFGWSYIVSWIGIAFLLFAAVFMLFSSKAIKSTVTCGMYVIYTFQGSAIVIRRDAIAGSLTRHPPARVTPRLSLLEVNGYSACTTKSNDIPSCA